MKSVEEMWEESIKGQIKFKPSEIKPLKKCFYAGVYSVLKELSEEHPEDSKFWAKFEEWKHETKKFLFH